MKKLLLLLVFTVSFTINNNPAYTDKIDNAATLGLSGTNNSLSYRVEELEKHFHNREKWFGAAAVPITENHVADRVTGNVSPFTLTAGNNTVGAWVQILGVNDTPVSSGMTKLDAHRFMVTATNSTNPYLIQIASGPSSNLEALVAAEQFTELPYISLSNNSDSGIEDVMTRRIDAGTKVWARTVCIGSNGSTLSFYYGIHEYVN